MPNQNPYLYPDFKDFTPADRNALVYDATSKLWKPGVPAVSLDELKNVNAPTPSRGSGIVWTGTEYQNRNIAYRIGTNAINTASTATLVEEVLHTWTIGANEFGTGARLSIRFLVETNNNANIKRFRVRAGGLAGTVYFNVNLDNVVGAQVITVDIYANGATNSQVGYGLVFFVRSGSTTTPKITSAINTTAAWTIVLTSQKAVAGDTVTVLHGECYLFS